jgi:hypothetical protein
MLSVTVPSVIRKVADRFKSSVDMPFGSLSAFFALHLFGCASLCEAVRQISWSPSVSALDRALQSFSSNRFMRRLRASILRRLKDNLNAEDFCFAVDDTIVEKYGKGIFRVGSWGKHGKGLVRGQRIMVLALVNRVRGVAIPLAFEVCAHKDEPGYQTGHAVAKQLLQTVIDDGFPKLTVAMDSWFDSAPFMADLDAMGFKYVIEAKGNRLVKRTPAPGAKWKRWKDLLHGLIKRGVKLQATENAKEPRGTKYIAEGYIFIRGRTSRLKAAAVYNKPTDGEFFAVYVTNDLKMSGGDMWAHARSRWHIEEMFRALKQSLSFAKIPASGNAATELSICIPFALFTSMVLEPELWTERKKATIGSIVSEFREHSLNHTLEEFEKGSRRINILKLKCRRRIDRNNKKPVNPTANELRCWLGRAA